MSLRVRYCHRLRDTCLQGIQEREKNIPFKVCEEEKYEADPFLTGSLRGTTVHPWRFVLLAMRLKQLDPRKRNQEERFNGPN